jgi:hypothetical protein
MPLLAETEQRPSRKALDGQTKVRPAKGRTIDKRALIVMARVLTSTTEGASRTRCREIRDRGIRNGSFATESRIETTLVRPTA